MKEIRRITFAGAEHLKIIVKEKWRQTAVPKFLQSQWNCIWPIWNPTPWRKTSEDVIGGRRWYISVTLGSHLLASGIISASAPSGQTSTDKQVSTFWTFLKQTKKFPSSQRSRDVCRVRDGVGLVAGSVFFFFFLTVCAWPNPGRSTLSRPWLRVTLSPLHSAVCLRGL